MKCSAGRKLISARQWTVIFGCSALFFLPRPSAAGATSATINAIGVENEYADVISQIGGKYVQARAIESDPNTDPHSFEISPQVARRIADADLIVENGAGYDDWADKIIAAAPKNHRLVIDVQQTLGLADNIPNPHLWYDPRTMPAVAAAVAADLTSLQPGHAGYFHANMRKFDNALQPWHAAIASLRHDDPRAAVAVTEPVGDYLLQAAGIAIATPFTLQAAIMNGTDPSPQDMSAQNDLLAGRHVQAFVYNQQVTDPLTQSFLALARSHGIPVVGVYETMPSGYSYQTWMVAEVDALHRAFANRSSTETLQAGSP